MQPASLPSTLSITAVGRHAVVPPGVAKALVNRRNDGERVGLPRQIARHIAVGQPRDDLKLGTHEGRVDLRRLVLPHAPDVRGASPVSRRGTARTDVDLTGAALNGARR
jgi:hypothetical protein